MTIPTERQAQAAEASLFDDLPAPSAQQVQQAQADALAKRGHGTPRLLEPNRLQIEMRASDLESLLAADHRARLVWGYVVRQNLDQLFDAVKARGSNAGRCRRHRPTHPVHPVAVRHARRRRQWPREVARLSQEHTTPAAESAAAYLSTTTRSTTFAVPTKR